MIGTPQRTTAGKPLPPNGFSTLELMIVVAILGVLAALAVPATTEMVRMHRARAEMGKARQALVELRNLARATRRCVKVEVTAHELKGTAYASCVPGASGPTLDGPDAAHVRTFSFLDGASLSPFDTGDGTLVFNVEGGTFLDDVATLVVTNDVGGEERRVRVWPAIGTVREER